MAWDDLKNLLIGIILVIVMVTCGLFIFGTFVNKNPSLDPGSQTAGLTVILNQSSQVTASVNEINKSINSVSADNPGILGLGWIDALVGSVYGGMKAIFTSIGFVNNMIVYVGSVLGVPASIIPFFYLLIIVVVGFAIWGAIMRVP